MKKAFLTIISIGFLLAAYLGWVFFGPTVSAPEKKYLFIKTGSSFEEVKTLLIEKKIIKNDFYFTQLSRLSKYNKNIKPGKYKIENNSSLFQLVRLLRSGKQSPARLVINKLRTKEDFASKLAATFEIDSTTAIRFLLSNDSLARYNVDTNTVMSIVIPNSYLFWWNTSIDKVFSKLKNQKDNFWDGERTVKAKKLGFTPVEIYTMASIIEEETNKEEDKGKIASVYINRMRKGMKLEADPTVKYSMRNFELKRILHGHLLAPSMHNTYQHTGLPPGPICSPSMNTIDAVLDAPETNYIFFVAKPDFSGYSNFASTYEEHLQFAKAYQHALDSLINSRSQTQSNK